jgi:hypothetical protein
MPGLLRQLPARFDFQIGEQTGDETDGRTTRLDPDEPTRERTGHQVDGSSPLGRLYAMTLGHRKV